MDHKDIQRRLDAMPAAMSAKGLRLPEAALWAKANEEIRCWVSWNTGASNRYSDEKTEVFRGSAPASLLDEAEAFIAALPSADETKRNTFLNALGKVIDLGNELGQDVGALASEMKRLASNALTDQRPNVEPAE